MIQNEIEQRIFKLCGQHNVGLGRLFGIYFGFPKCCIDAFDEGRWSHEPSSLLIGTGFIPCKKCQSKTEEELITEIAKHRFCDLPFPNCGSIMEYKHFTDMVLYGNLINIATS